MRSKLGPLIIGLGCICACTAVVAASETRAYAVSWFAVAGYYDPTGKDCPDGVNAHEITLYRAELQRLGYSEHDVQRLVAELGDYGPEFVSILDNRGRIDGKPVNVFANPESVPDPHLKLVQGHFGRGFNLDGQVKPSDFVDPDTGEKGVDNNLYRVIGCSAGTKTVKPPDRDAVSSTWQQFLIEQAPAQLIEITGAESLDKDQDNVVIGYYTSLDHLTRSPSGGAAAGMSMRIDPNARWHNAVHGKIRDGVLTTDVFEITLLDDPFRMPYYHFRQARLRLRLMPDGTLKGMLGGYLDWLPFYCSVAAMGESYELVVASVPAVYYALKRLAEAYPDSSTGQNTAISSAYEIEAVPAIVLHEQNPREIRR